ncbi:hypothetical protein V5O48_001816 [Marasmius crinis-equi]|uniref:Enhancer of mRNA-decapping protein 4 WD40 repeat region domain-containing protein n=1 Tax=Marasmius crinis-equi TaxID=585013 RepID=A0ABR3FXN1_9AGAR
MENRSNASIIDLFSRGSSPPLSISQQQKQQPQQQTDQQQQQQQHSQQPQSQPAYLSHNVSSSNQIDSLFQNISSPGSLSDHHHLPSSSSQSVDDYSNVNSLPTTPVMSISDDPVTQSAPSSISVSDSSRQSALLSLLGAPSSAPTQAAAGSQQAQQIPTPPGSSQRSGASPQHNEAQGKILLEQLMAGSNYSDSQRGSSLPGSAPTPPYSSNQHESEYRPYQQHDPAIESAQAPQPSMPQHAPSYQSPQSQPLSISQQQQPPSPRKTMFDFVSPFDALSSSSSVKKKQPPSVSSGNDDSSWTNVSDPKRQSVDNLLESLTRAQMPPPPTQTTHPSYDPYFGAGGEYTLGDQPRGVPPPPPLPPKPAAVPARNASPRASPPKAQAQRARMESPAGQHNQPSVGPTNNTNNNRRDKESSPGPGTRGSLRGKSGRNNKSVNSPSPQAQNIVFDVSQPLDEIQAPRDSVKSTAIALVRQDTVFLPGTTIGATTWVAYAMTRGRIRVISRSSGDRTLLQLPPIFPPSTSVTDMAVYSNRLAGVTSDGGFVVWELPDIITDDVPGQLLLCVGPAGNHEPLTLVKWHPKESDTLAVASESQIYLLNLAHAHVMRGRNLIQADLQEIAQVFTLSSPLVAFDFDLIHYTLASISLDSTLMIWNIHDQVPYSTHKVRGEDTPSSLTFVEGGIVVGRKNGTIYQLLSMTTKSVLSTVKFVNGGHEDPDMFGHSIYDARIQTLWVANSRRESMIALKISLESGVGRDGEEGFRGWFEQVVEFGGLKPTIHFVILSEHADPNGDEGYAACIAAKVTPGELALVAFSVHSSGVDQVLIRREWFDSALNAAQAKFPPYNVSAIHHIPLQAQVAPPPPVAVSEPAPAPAPAAPTGRKNAGSSQPVGASGSGLQPPARLRTPPSEEIEADIARDDSGRVEIKGKGGKGGKVKFGGDKSGSGSADVNESAIGQAITREIRKTEESLHTRIGKMLGKEMEKQHQRMEEARANEQAEDFARQEKILKLISNELTRNTTRVVEVAVKTEVQNSVLPSLENITKTEVKAALNEQVGKGLAHVISSTLPNEVEKLLTRTDISAHFAHILSTQLTPLIDRHIKDAISKTLMPVYSQQANSMHQELLRELRNEIHSVKAELTGWQNEALRNQESSIRDLERSVRSLTDQVKFLTLNHPTTSGPLHHLQQAPQPHSSPSGSSVSSGMNQTMHRQPNVSSGPPSSNYPGSHGNFPPPQPQGPPPPQQQITPQWFNTTIAAPQASHPATLPLTTQSERTPPIKPEQWDEIYLGVLHTQDSAKLRELLAHTNPELIMPLNGQVLVSQAVILTLVHRLSALIGEIPVGDESLKTSLWWLQRSVALLRPEDKLILDFIPRVIPNVQMLLNTTKQRLTIPIPGLPSTLDMARMVSDIQETLRRKVAAPPS